MSDVHFYQTAINWKEGCIGTISSEGLPLVTVATPPEFPNGVPNTWSPEHLFVASVDTCIMTTFIAIAENSKLSFKSYTSKAVGKLEKVDGRFTISEIEIRPQIILNEEKDIDKAKRIIEKAERACLISNSMKSKVTLNPEVKAEEAHP